MSLAPDRQRPAWLVHGLMVLASGLVATSFTVGKAITQGLDPLALTLCRFLLASLLFAPLVGHRLALPGLAALARYSLISGVLIAFFALMFLALRSTSSLHTSVLYTLVPGLSGVYAMVLVRERLGAGRLAALILAMVGALWVIFEGRLDLALAFAVNRGDLIFLFGCLIMALYMPLVRLLHRGEPMAMMTFWVMLTGCGWLLPLVLARLGSIDWGAANGRVWLGVAYLAVFCTIISFYITQWATLIIGPTRVMAYSYLCPPLVLLINACFGHGPPTWRTIGGVAIIVPAMFVLQAEGRTKAGSLPEA